jgi:hypothetical protein
MANYATGTGSTPIIVFPAGQPRTLEIIYAPAASQNATTSDIYDFVPVNGVYDAQEYLNNEGSYSLSPVVPPVVNSPNYTGFLNACYNDANAPKYPIALIYCQAFAQPGLSQAQLATLVTTAESVITTAYPTQAAAIINAIGGYLTQFNIPF